MPKEYYVSLTKVQIRNLKGLLKGYCENYDYSFKEIARGCFDIGSESFRLIKAKENVDAVRNVLHALGIYDVWDGENIRLYDSVTDYEYRED